MKKQTLGNIVHQITFAGDERLGLFLQLSENQQARVLLQLTKHLQYNLMSLLTDEHLVTIFNLLDPDEITDLIQLLPDKRQKKLVKQLNEDMRKSVEILKKFNPESAAGLMNLDYIQVDVNDKIASVAIKFKKHEKRTGRLPVIIVLEDGKLKGYLPGHELAFATASQKVQKFVRPLSAIRHDASHDDVVRTFRTHPHNKIAVLGNKKTIIGIIYSDDILKAMKESETSALYDFAGLHEEESVMDSITSKVKHRYKWLMLNLATAFLASFTVLLFDQVITKYVLLAAYMPIVAGMGGNAGTQTLAVMVRGIALKQINFRNAWPTLKRELAAGMINGLINASIVALIVMIINPNILVAIILGSAMIINLIVAGFFGTLVPLFMKKIGKDPAASATVFITTATDVLGFMAFLGLATMFL